MCDGCVAVLGGGKITVTIDADRHSESFCRVQVAFFKKPLLPLGERKTCLQVAFLTGLPVKSAFALPLDKSNRTEDEQVYEIGGVYNAKNDKRNGG